MTQKLRTPSPGAHTCSEGGLTKARGRVRFVWPAPGLPALLQGEECFAAIVAHDGADAEIMRNWGGRLALRGVHEGSLIPLEVEAVEPWDSVGADPLVSGFVGLSEARRFSFVRIILRPSQPLFPRPPRRVGLYDILADGQVERPRSVAAFVPSEGKLMLAFAADLHLAAAWDTIADAVARYAPDLAPGFLHPERLLEQFIGEVNLLAAKGQLDLVILGGDLVDHVYTHPRNGACGTSDDSNVKLLLDALAGLEVPSITIPGNHDYRLYPWRPRIYGMESVGIPASRTKTLLRRAGLWSRQPICLADLDAIRTDESGGRSALAHYLTQVAPATDFSLSIHGVRLIFASTGRDVACRWRDVEFARSGLLLRSLHHTRLRPDSEGLSDLQVAQIASWLKAPGGAALFFHAPLLRVTHLADVGHRVGRLEPGTKDSLASRVAFELRLKRAGVRNGVCFRNPGPLLRALAAAPGPVVAFSGHVHEATAVQFDRSGLVLQTAGPVHQPTPTEPSPC